MRTRQVIGILLIVIGLISLVWGGISWTHQETVLDIGPIEATRSERETVGSGVGVSDAFGSFTAPGSNILMFKTSWWLPVR